MSGPGRPITRLQALTCHLPDSIPVLEFQDWRCAQRTGGLAVLPWRGAWLDAHQAGVRADPESADPQQTWASALVHIQKGRAATETDLAHAWRRLAPGGHLHVLGANDLGVVSFARRLGEALGQQGERIATGGHGRLVRFMRTDHPGPPLPGTTHVPSDSGPQPVTLTTVPGVFSGDGLDEGTATLIDHLAEVPPPAVVLDLGCGAGHLAIAALRRWPTCRAVLLDADIRAVGCANANLAALGLSTRAEVHWWCEREPLSVPGCDLALVNPPCHTGGDSNPHLGLHLMGMAVAALVPHGRLLAVANRQLPYEGPLSHSGTVATVRQCDRFKVIEVIRG